MLKFSESSLLDVLDSLGFSNSSRSARLDPLATLSTLDTQKSAYHLTSLSQVMKNGCLSIINYLPQMGTPFNHNIGTKLGL